MKAQPDNKHDVPITVETNQGHNTRYASNYEVQQIMNNAERTEHGEVKLSNISSIDGVKTSDSTGKA